MKAIVLPFRQAEELRPFRFLCPDFLLPLVGKPVVEHLVEQLVSCGVRDVTLLCDDRPDEVSPYFGTGERWGCAVKTSPVREAIQLDSLLSTALHGVQGMVCCLPGNLVLSSGLDLFLAHAAENPQSITCPAPFSGGRIFAADAATLINIAQKTSFTNVDDLRAAASVNAVPVSAVETNDLVRLITAPADLLSIQRDVLEELLPGIRIPARKTERGIWIGNHTHIASGARLIPPVMLGSHNRIIGNCQIGPNAVIASHCLVNNSDLIKDSIIMSGTAAGPHTELNGVAARGGALLNLRSGVAVTAPDAFILGEVGAEAERHMPNRLLDSIAALLLLVLLAPFALSLFVLALAIPSMSRVTRGYGNIRMKSLSGEHRRLPFTSREFTFGPILLRRWFGLVQVLTGHLLLVGALPTMDSPSMEGELELDVPRGLFRIWEVEGDPPENDEERIARENYHAVTRTFARDLRIVVQSAGVGPASS